MNTCVAANTNRGLKEVSCEWIKFLAVDDTLLPDCIKENIHFIEINPDISSFFKNKYI